MYLKSLTKALKTSAIILLLSALGLAITAYISTLLSLAVLLVYSSPYTSGLILSFFLGCFITVLTMDILWTRGAKD
jgi:hypothetical protein